MTVGVHVMSSTIGAEGAETLLTCMLGFRGVRVV